MRYLAVRSDYLLRRLADVYDLLGDKVKAAKDRELGQRLGRTGH
jgi:hypothetical protein